VRMKLESLQVSSSFKARGAFNAVIARLERAGGTAPRHLVTASAGNHGRALSAAAERFGLPLTVFTPRDASRTKLAAIRRHGAALRPEASDYEGAERLALAYASETGAEFLSAYSDLDVIAGAGTAGLEIFEDFPDAEVVVVPMGGGGLISGIAIAAHAINPQTTVTGVEVEASCPFQVSLPAGRLVAIVAGPTLADGLSGNPDPGTITWDFIRRLVPLIVTVSETDLRKAVVGLASEEHLIVEGAGAASTAALLAAGTGMRGKRIAIVLSGANIDRATFASVIQ